MFGKVAAFELRYQLRQPLFWIVVAIFALLAFGVTSSSVISIGGVGEVHRNGPAMVAMIHLVFAFFFMFVTTAFVAGAVLKDDETGFGPILRATQLSKFDYVYGRFAGAFGAACVAYLAVTFACLVGGVAPWLDPDLVGPFNPVAYLYAYAVLALPSIFMTGAIFFALATVTRSMAWTFVGVIGFLVGYLAVTIALGKPDLEAVVARWEPFGIGAYQYVTRYWTVADRNTLTPPLAGLILFNRLWATGIGVACLAAAYPLYRQRSAGEKRRQRKAASEARAVAAPTAAATPPTIAMTRRTGFSQLAARTRFDMAQVFRSVAFWVILGLGLANCIGGLWESTSDDRYGGALWPVTRALIPVLNGAFVFFFPMVIAAYFAGEMVWRDRDRRMHEIIDATPAPDWTFVLPKVAAVTLVLWSTLLASAVAAVGVQAAKGYFNFEFEKYLLWYLVPHAFDFTMVAILAVFIQVMSPNKFVGWGVMLLWLVAIIVLPQLGLEHSLIFFGSPFQTPQPLSDMNGLGKFWIGAWWVRLYDLGIGLTLLVLSYALWRRGAETRYRPRFARLPRRLAGPAGLIGLAGVALLIGAGAFVFVNTNIWNDYRTRMSNEKWMADYEKALLRYEHAPQPSVVGVTLNVSIHPHQPMLETRGVYVLENRTGQILREVHVRFDRNLIVCALSLQGARPKDNPNPYERFNYRILTFDTPMLPGERRTMAFTTELTQTGFRNSGNLTGVVDNGTFVNSLEITPVIGMTRDQLLRDHAARRRQGLKYDLRPAPLGDQAARANNYIGHVGWTTSDITVTTDADQTPIAPGYKVSDVSSGGRRTARFVTEAPILQFFSVQSARYQTKTEQYKGVALTVYYDAQHPYNVDRMLRALEQSLDYYQANFSPYQFRQTRVLEFPNYAQFAQSFAGTFPWSEGLGFVADYRDPEKIDLVTYIAAHEFAHQWWAHQIIGADEQGATSLSETLAQYSALRVMRRMYGPDHIRKFLKFELDNYLRSRGGQVIDEQPLERVEPDQGYIHYRKGSLVMYRLADELGEDKVNAALRSLLAQYAFKGAPYPTSLDLVAALRAQATTPAQQQLITDLFEKITLYDVKTESVTSRRRADGRYDVTMTVSARKMYADGKGKETDAPMAEDLWVGLFGAKPGAAKFGAKDVIDLERRQIRTGRQTLTFITARAPTWGGADPYNELIDRNSDDNLAEVK